MGTSGPEESSLREGKKKLQTVADGVGFAITKVILLAS